MKYLRILNLSPSWPIMFNAHSIVENGHLSNLAPSVWTLTWTYWPECDDNTHVHSNGGKGSVPCQPSAITYTGRKQLNERLIPGEFLSLL